MDIFEFAMKMEKDGENYYRGLAAKTTNTGLRSIFTMLADAEVIHYNIFRKMKEHEKISVAPTGIVSGVRNIFEKMGEEKNTDVDITQVELYKKAGEIEKASQDFYLKQAGEAKDQEQKEIFLRIADEEQKHYFIVARIIDFVSQPQTWLENPEWYHLEEY
jgi:rubrerythrin